MKMCWWGCMTPNECCAIQLWLRVQNERHLEVADASIAICFIYFVYDINSEVKKKRNERKKSRIVCYLTLIVFISLDFSCLFTVRLLTFMLILDVRCVPSSMLSPQFCFVPFGFSNGTHRYFVHSSIWFFVLFNAVEILCNSKRFVMNQISPNERERRREQANFWKYAIKMTLSSVYPVVVLNPFRPPGGRSGFAV